MPELIPTLPEIVRRAGRLYSLPSVAMQVLQLTDRSTVDTKALKDCIEKDPALTSKVLKVVNSSLFGPHGEVADLSQALTLLGTKPLKLLVLGFSLPEELFHGVARNVLSRYWRDALTKAVAARDISENLLRRPGDEAFIAGLLHDLGMLVLIQEMGDPYIELIDSVIRNGGDLEKEQRDLIGFDHTALSSQLLGYWGLPKSLVAAIASSKSAAILNQLPSDRASLPQIVHLADLLGQLVSQHRLDVLPELLEAGKLYCGLTKSTLKVLVKEIEPKVEQLAEVLELDLPRGMSYQQVLVEAHHRMSEMAESSVESTLQKERRHASSDGIRYDQAADLAPKESNSTASPLQESFDSRSSVPGDGTSGNLAATVEEVVVESVEVVTEQVIVPKKDAVDPILLGRLTATVRRCRAQRSELSLVLLEIDNFEELLASHGRETTQQFVMAIEALCRRLNQPEMVVVRTEFARLGIVLPGCDRQSAVRLANHLVNGVKRIADRCLRDGRTFTSLSVGAATVPVPSKNFSPISLIESAQRCLNGARASGGSSVKSIEVC